MITQGVWMASVDLHHAYYSVQVHRSHSPYFSFLWQDKYYHYLRLPNGYAQAPLIFTKLLRLPFGYLRSQGHLSVVYMDDTYLQGDSNSSCQSNIANTVSVLQALGFTINRKKSVLTSTQSLEFLGFIINSVNLTITLTTRWKSNIAEVCTKLLMKTSLKIRFVSSAIGMIIAALPAVKHGPLHYRTMEADKNFALQLTEGDFDKNMTLSPQARNEVQWWVTHIYHSQKFLHAPPITTIIYSDASLEGWGATDSISTIGAPWRDTDELMHINVLELTAARLALKTLAKATRGTHIQLKMDNLTAIAYINRMGGTHSPECNHVSGHIWEWAIARDIWLFAAYIPGDSNVVADFHSRCFHENKEWALKEKVFALLKHIYGLPGIDLFASSTNAKMPVYISWLPDPNAFAVDAYTVSWQDIKFYAFPPFSLIPRVLAKIIQDKATGILIIPKWTTQSWFPLMLTLLIQHSRVISPCRELLYLPQQPQVVHPLHKKLSLLAVLLSGIPSRVSAHHSQLQPSSRNHGDLVLECNMTPFSEDGRDFVLQGKYIPCLQLS